MDFTSISLELDEKIDRNLKASERNALQALSLESKLSSLRQVSAFDKIVGKGTSLPSLVKPGCS